MIYSFFYTEKLKNYILGMLNKQTNSGAGQILQPLYCFVFQHPTPQVKLTYKYVIKVLNE